MPLQPKEHRNPRELLRTIQTAVAARYRDLVTRFGDIWSSDETKSARLKTAADLMTKSRTASEVMRGAKLIEQDSTSSTSSFYPIVAALKRLATRVVDAVTLNSLSPIWGVTSECQAVMRSFVYDASTDTDAVIKEIAPNSVTLAMKNIKLRNLPRMATRLCRVLRDFPRNPEDRVQIKYDYDMVRASEFNGSKRYYYMRYEYMTVTGETSIKYAALGTYKTTKFEQGVRASSFEVGRTYYTDVACKDDSIIAVTAGTFANQPLYFMPDLARSADRARLFTREKNLASAREVDATGELFDTLWSEHIGSEMCYVDNLTCAAAKILIECAQKIVSISGEYKRLLRTSSPSTSSAEFTKFASDMAAYSALRGQIVNCITGTNKVRLIDPNGRFHTYDNLGYTYNQKTILNTEVTDQEGVRPWDVYELSHMLMRIDFVALLNGLKSIATEPYVYTSRGDVKAYASELFEPLMLFAKLFTDLVSLADGFVALKKMEEDPDAGVDIDSSDGGGDDGPGDPSAVGSGWTYLGHLCVDWSTRIQFTKSSEPKIKLAVVIWPKPDDEYVGYRLRSVFNNGKNVSFQCTQAPDQRVHFDGTRVVIEGYFGKCVYMTDPFVYVARTPIDLHLSGDNPYTYIPIDGKTTVTIEDSLYKVTDETPTTGVYQEISELRSTTLAAFDHAHKLYWVQTGTTLTRIPATTATPTVGVKYIALDKNQYFTRTSNFDPKYVQVYAIKCGDGGGEEPDYPGGGPSDPYGDEPGPGGSDPDGPIGTVDPYVPPTPVDPSPDTDPDDWKVGYNIGFDYKLGTMQIRIHQDYVPDNFLIQNLIRGDVEREDTFAWTDPTDIPSSGKYVFSGNGKIKRTLQPDADGYYTYVIDRIKRTPVGYLTVTIVKKEDEDFFPAYVKKPSFSDYVNIINPLSYSIGTGNGQVQYAGSASGALDANMFASLVVRVDNTGRAPDEAITFDYIALAPAEILVQMDPDTGDATEIKIPLGYMKQYTAADNGKMRYFKDGRGRYISEEDAPSTGTAYCKSFDDETAGWVPVDSAANNTKVLYSRADSGNADAATHGTSSEWISSSANGLYTTPAGRLEEPLSSLELSKIGGADSASTVTYEIRGKDIVRRLRYADINGRTLFVRFCKPGTSSYNPDDLPELTSEDRPKVFKMVFVDRDPVLNRTAPAGWTPYENLGYTLLYGKTEREQLKVLSPTIVGVTDGTSYSIRISALHLASRIGYDRMHGEYEFVLRAVSGSAYTALAVSGGTYMPSTSIIWTDLDRYMAFIPLKKTTDDPNAASTAKKKADWVTRIISACHTFGIAQGSTSGTKSVADLYVHRLGSGADAKPVIVFDADSSAGLNTTTSSDVTVNTTMPSSPVANAIWKKTGKTVAQDFYSGPVYNAALGGEASDTTYEVEMLTTDYIYLNVTATAYAQIFGTTASGASITDVMFDSGFAIYGRRKRNLRTVIQNIAFSSLGGKGSGDYKRTKFATDQPSSKKSSSFPGLSTIKAKKNSTPYLAGSNSVWAPKKAGTAVAKGIIATARFRRGVWGVSGAYASDAYDLKFSFGGARTTDTTYGSTAYHRYAVNPLLLVNTVTGAVTTSMGRDGSTIRAPRNPDTKLPSGISGVVNMLFCIDSTNMAAYMLPYYDIGSTKTDAAGFEYTIGQPMKVSKITTKDNNELKHGWNLVKVIDGNDSGTTTFYRIYGSAFRRRRKKVTNNNTTNAKRYIYLNLDWGYNYLFEMEGPKLTPKKSLKQFSWPSKKLDLPAAGSSNKVNWAKSSGGSSDIISMQKAASFTSGNVVKRSVYDSFYSELGTMYTILELPNICGSSGNGSKPPSGLIVFGPIPKDTSVYVTRLDPYDENEMVGAFANATSRAQEGSTIPDIDWEDDEYDPSEDSDLDTEDEGVDTGDD